MEILHLTIKGRIPSKKNNRRTFGRRSIPSERYIKWEIEAGQQLDKYKDKMMKNIELQFEFWMPDNRKTDLDNKVSSILDLLQKLEIIEGDHWQVLPFYSVKCNGLDKENPRAEIWIKETS